MLYILNHLDFPQSPLFFACFLVICTSCRNHFPMKSTSPRLGQLGWLGFGTGHHTGFTGPTKFTGSAWSIHRGQFIVSAHCPNMSCTSKRGRFARFGTAASCKEDGQVKPFSGKRLQNTWDLMSPSSFLESYHDIMTS